jgi:CMP-N-acetylneuraminic acid synthetase
MNILAIIPARAGSKGLPRKSILPLNNIPLIIHTFDSAKKSNKINKIIVNSNDIDVIKLAKENNIEYLIRPEELATDESSLIGVILHTLKELEKQKYVPDVIVILQPTSPLRLTEDIDKAIELFLNNKFDSLVSMKKMEHPIQWCFKKKGNKIEAIEGLEKLKKRRQDLEETYCPNGAIYIISYNKFIEKKSLYTEDMGMYLMPHERSIDIDTKFDLDLCEFILKDIIKKS